LWICSSRPSRWDSSRVSTACRVCGPMVVHLCPEGHRGGHPRPAPRTQSRLSDGQDRELHARRSAAWRHRLGVRPRRHPPVRHAGGRRIHDRAGTRHDRPRAVGRALHAETAEVPGARLYRRAPQGRDRCRADRSTLATPIDLWTADRPDAVCAADGRAAERGRQWQRDHRRDRDARVRSGHGAAHARLRNRIEPHPP